MSVTTQLSAQLAPVQKVPLAEHSRPNATNQKMNLDGVEDGVGLQRRPLLEPLLAGGEELLADDDERLETPVTRPGPAAGVTGLSRPMQILAAATG
ncbi:hypothetical protein CTA1_1584 [Colletotrichum tanaceti]|uniref:Uncharacterized protein n=1 Tax=Colletotrichum tanaceti TaxID=1306861 RepID=A0A4V6DFV2_9PEZI|nr:hypothetical protein CTA1_1584 [Colletotrichum tanaceti]